MKNVQAKVDGKWVEAKEIPYVEVFKFPVLAKKGT